MSDTRAWLDDVKEHADRLRGSIPSGIHYTADMLDNMAAALRAVLDLIDSADANPGPYARILHTTQVRNAVAAHLEDR